jgi:hypothetical protein
MATMPLQTACSSPHARVQMLPAAHLHWVRHLTEATQTCHARGNPCAAPACLCFWPAAGHLLWPAQEVWALDVSDEHQTFSNWHKKMGPDASSPHTCRSNRPGLPKAEQQHKILRTTMHYELLISLSRGPTATLPTALRHLQPSMHDPSQPSSLRLCKDNFESGHSQPGDSTLAYNTRKPHMRVTSTQLSSRIAHPHIMAQPRPKQ